MNCKNHINAASFSLQNEYFGQTLLITLIILLLTVECYDNDNVHTCTEYCLTIQIINAVIEDSSPLRVKVELKSQHTEVNGCLKSDLSIMNFINQISP